MDSKTFDPHAKILHKGQYFIKQSQKVSIPVKAFHIEQNEEHTVRMRIEEMQQQIVDLERQINNRRKISEEQAEQILSKVKDEAKKVMEEAEQHAFNKVQQSLQEKETLLEQTNQSATRIIDDAEEKSKEIINQAHQESINIKDTAQKNGQNDGYTAGLEQGKTDISYLVDRLHSVVAETARERERILVHSENQVINLVLTMVGKVVKKMTAEHKDIVVENTKAALELLRGAMTIFIRVSPHDFNYLTSFKEYLVGIIESRADIKFIEDPMIEPGGVYVESETGDIDATIRSQLDALDTQMRFYMPVKVKSPETLRREEKIREEQERVEQYEQLRKNEAPPTTFAQRDEFISSEKFYKDPQSTPSETLQDTDHVVDEAPMYDPINNVVDQSTNNQSINESINKSDNNDSVDIISDDEMKDDSFIQEAMDSYKDQSEDLNKEVHDEDITI
ncbi:MAG: FliH/SctL family protein [Brevinema sp.]